MGVGQEPDQHAQVAVGGRGLGGHLTARAHLSGQDEPGQALEARLQLGAHGGGAVDAQLVRPQLGQSHHAVAVHATPSVSGSRSASSRAVSRTLRAARRTRRPSRTDAFETALMNAICAFNRSSSAAINGHSCSIPAKSAADGSSLLTADRWMMLIGVVLLFVMRT